jgi:hypothetical protein
LHRIRPLRHALAFALAVPALTVLAAEPPVESREKLEVAAEKQPQKALSVTGAPKTDTPTKDLPENVKAIPSDRPQAAGVTQLAQAQSAAASSVAVEKIEVSAQREHYRGDVAVEDLPQAVQVITG